MRRQLALVALPILLVAACPDLPSEVSHAAVAPIREGGFALTGIKALIAQVREFGGSEARVKHPGVPLRLEADNGGERGVDVSW